MAAMQIRLLRDLVLRLILRELLQSILLQIMSWDMAFMLTQDGRPKGMRDLNPNKVSSLTSRRRPRKRGLPQPSDRPFRSAHITYEGKLFFMRKLFSAFLSVLAVDFPPPLFSTFLIRFF